MNLFAITFKLLIILPLLSFGASATHEVEPEKVFRELALETPIGPVLEEIQSVNCDASSLSDYLKQELIEKEQLATKRLDDYLRESFKFHESEPTPDDRIRLFTLAKTGTSNIRERFNNKWKEISLSLASHSNPRMKSVGMAIQGEIEAINKEYEGMISTYAENLKTEVKFTGIGCAACKVGYSALSKGLKENKLTRADKVDMLPCPDQATFDGKQATLKGKIYGVTVYPENGQVMLTDPGMTVQRPVKLPIEMPILRAMNNYFEEHIAEFTGPRAKKQVSKFREYYANLTEPKDGMSILKPLLKELAEKKSQKEKFEHTLKWLKNLEQKNKPTIKAISEWAEQLRGDKTRDAERKSLHVSLGIPESAVVTPKVIKNSWAKGRGVDYTNMEGGPKEHNKDSGNSLLSFVKSTLGSPASDTTSVLISLTGACFFCDAAMWAQLEF